MKIAISQPTYLPWIGYFDLIDQVDLFVFLDNVQFAKRSWQQRNRIKTNQGLRWLTVPVLCGGRFAQLIKDVQICDSHFCNDHIRALEHAYKGSPFFQTYFSELTLRIEQSREGLLVELNLNLIHWAMEVLGLTTPLIRASTLDVSGKRTELLASICEAVDARQYISPLGSAGYLIPEQKLMRDRGIELYFHNYEHPEYSQLFSPFEPFASIVDLIFNEGTHALSVLRSGRRPPFSCEEISTLPIETPNANCVA